MVDSGIKLEKSAVDKLQTFVTVSNSIYDYVILCIEVDPNAPPPKGKQKPKEHVVAKAVADKGSCAAKYEGIDLKGVPPVYHELYTILTTEYKDKAAIPVFYLEYLDPSRGVQMKLTAICWIPETTVVGDKMKYSSTSKSVYAKCPDVNIKKEIHDEEDLRYKSFVKECAKIKL